VVALVSLNQVSRELTLSLLLATPLKLSQPISNPLAPLLVGVKRNVNRAVAIGAKRADLADLAGICQITSQRGYATGNADLEGTVADAADLGHIKPGQCEQISAVQGTGITREVALQ